MHLRELYEKLPGSQKTSDMLLDSQRTSLRKEGLGCNLVKVKAKKIKNKT